jgi:hypothetical protein
MIRIFISCARFMGQEYCGLGLDGDEAHARLLAAVQIACASAASAFSPDERTNHLR